MSDTEVQNISKAVIKTNMGDITVKFYGEDSPKTVSNFVKLAKEGFYTGTRFHRVIKDFMIQGGDPTGTGTGGESFWGVPFKDEVIIWQKEIDRNSQRIVYVFLFKGPQRVCSR